MTRRISFKTWIFGATMLVVLLTLVFVGVLLQRSLSSYSIGEVKSSLFHQTTLLSEIVKDRWKKETAGEDADALADFLSSKLGLRVTLIAPDGLVIGDSDLNSEQLKTLENHADRPEVIQAIGSGKGWSLRYSTTLGVDLLYAAELIGEPETPTLVVRLAMPMAHMADNLSRMRRLILIATLVGALLSLVAAFVLAHRITLPVMELKNTAAAISSGDLHKRMRYYPNHEIGDLGRAFDKMADDLLEEIEEVTRARDRLEAILRGMVEGVMVTDEKMRITDANRALRDLLDLRINPIGRTPSEVTRNADLIDAFRQVSEGTPYATLEIRTLSDKQKTLEVEIAALPGEGRWAGVVAVFHDITERRKLEEMRRDFVANVSHELRTPLSAVRGAVETLLDGALDNPKFARKFTEVIERHVKRLENLVLDLLNLGRLESGEKKGEYEDIPIRSLAEASLNAVAELAAIRQVELEKELFDRPLYYKGNLRQLEQALVNLLENAVKYTEPGGKVKLTVKKENGELRLIVSDTGIGIPQSHLPRIFERFYRVDKDRSREIGGTGLGLAIVKHVVQGHGGRVEVDSVPNEGSTFSLIFPTNSK